MRQLQLGLREFLQRNIEGLPSKFFEQIEDIIIGQKARYDGPRYRNQPRRMADSYKQRQNQIIKDLAVKKLETQDMEREVEKMASTQVKSEKAAKISEDTLSMVREAAMKTNKMVDVEK